MAELGTTELTIQGHTFVVPYRYAAGHVLKENEAKALNQTFHENLRNNFASTVKGVYKETYGETIPENATLSEDQIADLQVQLEDIADKYEFNVRSGVGATPRDPIAAEALRMALSSIKESIRAQGGSVKEYGAEALNEAAKRLVASDLDYTKVATRIVHERQALTQKPLGSILEKVA